jgi:bifunctional non-homologous end joining protein LigD
MEVEDHPIEYNTFEGTIPKGQYGGGTVMLWDRGTYEAEDGGGEESLRDGYERGDLKIVMHGKRLQGGWVLVRMRREAGRAQWLLIKHRDEYATTKLDITDAAQTSVTTGRTMDEIANGRSRVWQSNRESAEPAAKKAPAKKPVAKKSAARKSAAKKPARKTVRATRAKTKRAKTAKRASR